MTGQFHIQYLEREKLDIEKWDQCIRQSVHPLIYAYSWYLDAMAKNWAGLVLNDYEAVMPLPWNKKMGIQYAYQPPFTAALGVFGKEMNTERITAFIAAIPAAFRLVEIPLNHANPVAPGTADIQYRENYVLNLSPSYPILNAAFRDNTKRNMKKALQAGCYIKKEIEVEKVIALAEEQLSTLTRLGAAEYARFKSLYELLKEKGKATTYGVQAANNELIASCVYFFSDGRAYYILVGNHPNGKTIGASHLLIDAFIQDHAGQPLLLDFEGSDIRNLAFFYSGFGATLEPYPMLMIKRLPWWARWRR